MTETAVMEPPTLTRVDIGCGTKKQKDFIGVDAIAFPGVDHVLNAGRDRWPFEDESVDEIHCSHFLEHLTNFNDKWERVHFFNELHRVLKPGAKATVILPHWCSTRFYGDPTHKEPWSELGFYYLSRDWRKDNAPHCDSILAPGPQSYSCDLECTWAYSLHQAIIPRNAEFQQHAMSWYKEAVQDIIATIKKKAT